jgi:hypothetical protein
MGFTLQNDPPKVKPAPKIKREKRDTKDHERQAAFFSNLVPYADECETEFRHSHWKARRARVRDALASVGSNDFFMNRFDECGSECTVEWSPTLQRYRVRANYCHCRHCEPCMRSKAGKLAANLAERLRQDAAKDHRFITLTLRHSNAPLKEQIDKLYASFKTLKATKLWKESQNGGAAMLEVKWDEKTRKWHPHLHVVSEGSFIRQSSLSREWHKITGDSFIVDVRRLKDNKETAQYIAKYVAKGTSAAVWQDRDAAQEWIGASKGVRSCNTFGSWRGYRLTATTETASDWRPIASLKTIYQHARAGQEWAMGVLLALRPPGDYDHPAFKRPKAPPPE